MLSLDRLLQRIRLSNARDIRRAIRFMAAILVISVTLFGGYYYWDRYIHPGDKSPLELDIERMEQAVSENPSDPQARMVLAEYYMRKGKYSEALDQTSQVLNLYPDHEAALLISGVTCVHMDQPDASLDSLEKFIELRKDRPSAGMDTALETAYYFLGESYVKLNRPAEAISALEAALTINPTDADAIYQLGLAHQANGQPELALEHYHRAVRFVPNFVEVYNSMIESYSSLEQPDYVVYAGGMQALCLQDYETAQIYLDIATQALPDFAPAFLGLGLAHEKAGNLQMALVAIQQALELDPGDYAAQHAHGRIQTALNSQDQ